MCLPAYKHIDENAKVTIGHACKISSLKEMDHNVILSTIQMHLIIG